MKPIKLTAFVGLVMSCCTALKAQDAPPQILVQPTNVATPIFGSAIFSVTVQSAIPVSYQWVFNGKPIANETNADLVLGQLTCAQNGYYSVIVSNAAGVLSSSKAELGVEQAVSSLNDYAFQDFLLQFCNITSVTAGSGTAYALMSDGTVAGYIPYVSPVLEVPPGLSDVIAISGGYSDVLALKSDGTVTAWGYGGPVLTNVPVGLASVTAVAAGGNYNLALQSNGQLVAWGTSIPPSFDTISNIVAISLGGEQLLELAADGTVFAWEGNTMEDVPGWTNVIAITSGNEYTQSLALMMDGTVVGWGGVATNPLPGVSNVVAIASSEGEFLALKSDGTIATSDPYLTFPFALSNVCGIAYFESVGIAILNDGSPVLTVQPGNQFPAEGGMVWLHARAVSAQPLNYQWQLNGTNILDATNADLTITNAQENDAGQYSALASNNLGSVSSRLASVAITPSPPIKSPYTLAQALDTTNLVWTTSSYFSSAPGWFSEVTNTQNGIAAAQSGAISNSSDTYLETTVTGPGTLTFWWSVSSEEYFDFLSFYIGYQTPYVARISGKVGWEQETFPISAGVHELQWIYSKDPDVSAGEDAGWLSEVSFVPAPMPVHLSLPTLLPNGTLQFSVSATNGSSVPLTNATGLVFEASSNLVDWIPLTNALTLTNGSAQLTDPDATNSAARFYRLVGQ